MYNVDNLVNDLNHVDELIRKAAYIKLVDAGQEIVPDLVEMYPDVEGTARLMLLRALGEIGDERAVEVLLDAMTERDRESYFLVPSLAGKALAQIGGEAAVEGLRDHLEHRNSGVRRMAIAVLGQIGEGRAIDVLRHALNHTQDDVREQAIKTLRKLDTLQTYAILSQAGHV